MSAPFGDSLSRHDDGLLAEVWAAVGLVEDDHLAYCRGRATLYGLQWGAPIRPCLAHNLDLLRCPRCHSLHIAKHIPAECSIQVMRCDVCGDEWVPWDYSRQGFEPAVYHCRDPRRPWISWPLGAQI